MPINELYEEYFQKSKTFLLPALGIRRCNHTAGIMTFINWPEKFTFSERKLIVCKTGNLEDLDYRNFEKIFLLSNVYYQEMQWVNDNTIAYIFSLEKFKDDWDHFLHGRYSQFSPLLKERIKQYFGERSIEWDYIKSYLYPEKYFELYASLLYTGKDEFGGLELLRSVGELCSPYNEKLETLQVSDLAKEKTVTQVQA